MSEFAPQHILCPVDLSPASNVVLSWARLLAQVFHSKVEVIHADWSEPPRYFTSRQLGSLEAEAVGGRQMLEDELRALSQRILGPRVDFSVSVIEGHAVEVILKRLAQKPTDLVIMGSHGRSGVSRILLGSVAENVAREAHLPTLIVRGGEIPPSVDHLERILCPVNLSEAAQEYVKTASQLAMALGAELNVLQALEQDDTGDAEISRQHLCEWVPDSVRRHCNLSEVVLKGEAAAQIILYARREGADLIVLGNEQKSFLEFRVLGRTAERVLRHGPTSVLLLPTPATRDKPDSSA
jgi:nucleotide-binding universal stress UspA family protein